MGALMGCVLSPDRAKLLLDSVLRAITAVARGVKLFGFSADGIAQTISTVTSLAYADDWAGCFSSLAELKRAWQIWALWDHMRESAEVRVTGGLACHDAHAHEAPRDRLRPGSFLDATQSQTQKDLKRQLGRT